MKHPKKIYLPNDKRMFDVYSSNLLENDISYISIANLKEWANSENEKLEYAGIIRINELLQFIEEDESIYKI